MARGEDRAAVLIGEDGRLERPYLARAGYYLGLVHADERAQDRERAGVLRDGESLHRLARDLPEVLARYERFAAVVQVKLAHFFNVVDGGVGNGLVVQDCAHASLFAGFQSAVA